MTNTSRVCPKCGATVFADAPQGCCSVCLVRTGLASLDDENDEASEPTVARMLKDFGDYELLQEIGRGGQGVVYRARQKSLNRVVALKVIGLAHWATEAHVRRFRLEAEAAASLNHPCIVPIYEVGERDGACYFSMGLVEGGQLDAVAKREPMPIRHAAELIAKLARTVHYAHEHGILHRDIKPGNILLDATGEPHLTDFGLARLIETESTVTRTLEVLGTPSYMAPEQAVGNNARVSSATDIYGLGAVLYQLLTGHPPFAGGTTFETVRLVLDTEPRQPRLWNQKIDRDLATICLKCLDKDPLRRYSSALALAEDLERWLKHEPIRARRTGIFTRGRKWVRRNPSSALLAASLVALAAAIGALALALPFYWHRNPTTTLLPEKSIAVLPFENRSEDKANAYFTDGIQDEILTRLSKIADLKVISRTSTQHYKSAPKNLPEIAKQLGVAHILEGSVQKSGDAVRVNVQLIKAANDSHLWADTFDCKLSDIFSVESEVAKNIADQLRAKLTGQEEQAISAKPTDNVEAYDAYLRGLAFEGRSSSSFATYSPDLTRKAAGFYERAVRLDPNFALAWARLSRVNAHLYFSGQVETTADQREAAKRALDNAQKLEPNSPETLLALGYYQYHVLRDYGAAKTTFGRVSKMLPNNSEVPMALGRVTRREGHWDESVAYFEQALTLDPRNVGLLVDAASTYTMLRQFPTALKLYDRALDITPNDPDLMASKAGIYQAQGNLLEAATLLSGIHEPTPSVNAFAIKIIQLRLERNYGEAVRLLQDRQAQFHFASEFDKSRNQVELALAQRLAGDTAGAKASAEEARNTLEQLYRDQPDNAFALSLSQAYAAMGEKDLALKTAVHPIMLLPRAKDSKVGPMFEENLALIQTMLGENSGAISTLTRLLQTPYGSVIYGQAPITPTLLRLDPLWDPIRNDPRFQELVAENASLPEKSIAVLPFQNLSKDEENAFFAAGVQDEILTNLAKIADLKVISRTSVMKYKSDLERNLPEIARTLGVSHVVEGSVQRAGGRVRVSAQLIDARNDAHVWAEHYDRDVADVFAVQTEIAQQIAEQLQAKLSPAEKAAIAELPTTDPVAYAYYTGAMTIGDDDWEGAEKGLSRAAELLEKATQRDPNFALAYCELAKTYGDLYLVMTGDPKDLELAKKAAEAAVRVRPDLGETHLALARYYFNASFSPANAVNTANFDRAREELTIARRNLPNNSEALFIAARIDRHQNLASALANLQKANDLDPGNGQIAFWLGDTYFKMRRYYDWEQLIKKCAASGTFKGPWIQNWVAEIKLAQGDPGAAQSLLDQVPLDFSPINLIWQTRFNAALYLRDYDAADRVIAATPAKFANDIFLGQPPESLVDGEIAHARGDKQKALAVFAAARKNVDAAWRDKPKDHEYYRRVAELDAGLGRKEDAIREALRAVDLMPIAKDPLFGPFLVTNLAQVYAWTGERDRALEQLEIVATIPAGPSYGDLRFNPCWDSLRGDPRFDKIVAAAKAASR